LISRPTQRNFPFLRRAARHRHRWAPAATALLLGLAAVAGAQQASRPEVVTSPHGAVEADDGRCSAIGRDALREGGTAVDAAVATALCLGVVSPASSGVGGGAFMLVWLADGKAVVYDSRETAPLAASKVSALQCRIKERVFASDLPLKCTA
jgi:gamma-glutamyltranspeptidase / glutathione hydrolase / leukotriene-C4 hydrolase